MCAEAQRLAMVGQSVHGEVREMRKQRETESKEISIVKVLKAMRTNFDLEDHGGVQVFLELANRKCLKKKKNTSQGYI